MQRNTEWHETYEKYAMGRQASKANAELETELSQANRELKVLRNRRLQELYTQEWKE